VNDDLVGPLVSESFANMAITATANYPSSGSSSSSAAAASLAIAFDALTGGYQLTVGSRSQTFLPSHRDATLSSIEADVFKRTSGTTTDTLTLTTNAISPGTEASPQYRYVGGGVWQRTIQDASGTSGTADIFTYGVATLLAAVPRSGSAIFPLQLRGIAAYGDAVQALRGTGAMSLNFAGNSFSGTGTFFGFDTSGNRASPEFSWRSAGSISTTANRFAGNFGIGFLAGPGVTDTSGRLTGMFFGPAAEELGATWFWKDPIGGSTYAGFLLGKNRSLFPSNPGLDNLTVNETFASASSVLKYTRDKTTNLLLRNSNAIDGSGIGVRYDETQAALVLKYGFVLQDLALTAAIRDAAASTTSFDAYRTTKTRTVNPYPTVTDTFKVNMFKPGSANTQLALTYTSFGTWEAVQPDPAVTRYEDLLLGVFAYGRKTPDGEVPVTGSATYSGLVYGNSEAPVSGALPYQITGNVTLTYQFAAPSLTGVMTPVATDRVTGVQTNLGQYAFAALAGSQGMSLGSSTWTALFERGANTGSNAIYGQFTGPAAQEFFAQWGTFMDSPAGAETLRMTGVMVGKRN